MERQKVIERLGLEMLEDFSIEQIEKVNNLLNIILADYQITSVCKELIVYEDENETLLKRFAGCLIIEGKSPKTVRIYVKEIRRFATETKINLKDATVNTFRTFFALEMKRGKKKISVCNTKNFINAFYRWAKKEGEIENNPLDGVGTIKFEKEIKPPFTAIEIDKMRTGNLTLRERAIIELLLSSGIRVSELVKLNRSDIDFNTLRVNVRQGKGGKDRITYINQVASYHLKAYLNSRNDLKEELIINENHGGKHIKQRITDSGVRQILKAIGKRLDIPDIHPHKFRHTFATNLYNKGMDLHEIQRLMGHNNLDTTTDYIESDDFMLENSYRKHII